MRLLPGRVVPGTRYRLLRWLGEGGMGVVYEAEHVDLGRHVAVKLLRVPEQLDSDAAQSFRDEARTASNIGSQYIIDVFDFGELADGRLMYAMELVPGPSAAECLDDGPLTCERVIPIFRQACKGLAAAHRAGVVHSDIKPENILLARVGGRDDHVKIVDFGIARIHNKDGTNTLTGAGSPPYMAPEQCLGHPYDGRLDMYALGCTVYEMLVGHPPFPGLEVRELLDAHVTTAPTAASQALRESGHERPPIPAPIEAIVMRCLAKRPEDRFADMDDLEAAICEAQLAARIETPWDDLPLPDVEPERRAGLLGLVPSFDSQPARPRWRIPALTAAGAAVAAIAIMVLARPDPPDEVAVGQLETLTDNARVAASRAYFVYPPLEDPAGATAYRVVRQIESLEFDDATIDEDRSVSLREEFAATLERLGDHYWEAEGGRGFAMDYYAQSLLFDPERDQARERAGILPGELARLRTLAEHGGFSMQELRAARALVVLAEEDPEKRSTELLALHEEETGLSPAQEARLYALAGTTPRRATAQHERVASPADPEPAGAEVEAEPPPASALDPEPGAAPPTTEPARDKRGADELATRGASALRAGRADEASQLFHRALAADPRNAKALIGLSDLAFDHAQYKSAASYGEKAVRARPNDPAFRIRLGDAYFKLFRFDDARTHYLVAKRLGHTDAGARIDKVDKKLGK